MVTEGNPTQTGTSNQFLACRTQTYYLMNPLRVDFPYRLRVLRLRVFFLKNAAENLNIKNELTHLMIHDFLSYIKWVLFV